MYAYFWQICADRSDDSKLKCKVHHVFSIQMYKRVTCTPTVSECSAMATLTQNQAMGANQGLDSADSH
jgi:hypothetical protein